MVLLCFGSYFAGNGRNRAKSRKLLNSETLHAGGVRPDAGGIRLDAGSVRLDAGSVKPDAGSVDFSRFEDRGPMKAQ